MSPERGKPNEDRRLDRMEDLGYRTLRAFAPWLLIVCVPAVAVRLFLDPTWLPPELGFGGLVASGAGYLLRWRFPISKEAPAQVQFPPIGP